jgi:hypothetical protein
VIVTSYSGLLDMSANAFVIVTLYSGLLDMSANAFVIVTLIILALLTCPLMHL